MSKKEIPAFRITMPKWMQVLPASHEVIAEAVEALKDHTAGIKKTSTEIDTTKVFVESKFFASLEVTSVDTEKNIVTYNIVPKPELYYQVLSAECGTTIAGEPELVAFVRSSGAIKLEYDRLRSALSQAHEHGYGVVTPTFDQFTLHEPQMHKSGRNFGIKLRATAPSLHMVRVDIQSEVIPTIGTQGQAEDVLSKMRADFESGSGEIWQNTIFGRTLDTIMQEGISAKADSMPQEARRKMKRTLTKITNNGRGGVICILL